MKRTLFVFVLTIASPFFCFAQGITANSKINQVVVFSEDALVNRVANVKLNAGEDKIIFSDIIPEIDEDSLRVSGSGSAEVKILGAQVFFTGAGRQLRCSLPPDLSTLLRAATSSPKPEESMKLTPSRLITRSLGCTVATVSRITSRSCAVTSKLTLP